jgi:ATP-binding cassette, subfamily B, bacterial
VSTTVTGAAGTSMATGDEISAWATIKRGAEISPELTEGFRGTMALALLGTAGRVVVPIVV